MADLKFTGSFAEVKASLDGVQFLGENGAAPILNDVCYSEDKDGNDQLEFKFQISSWKRPNESDAAEPLETREYSVVWTIKGDQGRTVRTINDGLGLSGDDALKDDNVSWVRLVAEDAPKSLTGLIGKPTKGFYLTAKVTQSAKQQAENSPDFSLYWNMYAKPNRASAKNGKVKLDSLLKKLNITKADLVASQKSEDAPF